MTLLDTISTRLSEYVSDEYTDRQEKETIEYGIYMFFSELIKLTAIIILAILIGKFKDALIIIASLGLLRNYMGGIHAKTHLGCFVSYALTLVSIYCCSKYLEYDTARFIILGALPFVLWAAYRYSPADTEFKPILSKKLTARYRKLSFSLIMAYYVLFLILPLPYNFYLGFSVIAETILILPVTYKLYKIKYGKDVSL